MDFSKFRSIALWIISIGVIILCCGIIIYYNLNTYGNTSCLSSSDCFRLPIKPEAYEQCESVCTSGDCIKIANEINSNMDPGADACEDFYQFACGNFHNMYHGRHGTIIASANQFSLMLKDVIETSEETHYPESAAQKFKIVYDSCIDTTSSGFTSLRYMVTFINEIGIVNWPNLDRNIGYFKTHLPHVLGNLIPYNENVFMAFRNKGEDAVLLEYPYEIFDDYSEKDLKNSLLFILRIVGLNLEDAKNITKSFLDVKHTINKIIENASNYSSRSYRNETSPAREDCTRENINNTSILCEVLRSAFENGARHFQFLIIEDEYSYFKTEISRLLENYDQWVLAHYIALRIFLNNLSYMNFQSPKIKSVDHIGFEESNKLLERWEFCISYLKSSLVLPLGLIYVSEIWKQEDIDLIEEMGAMFQKATSLIIRAQDWLADDTKLKIISEITKVKRKMADIIISYRNRINANATITEMLPENETETRFLSSELSGSKFVRGFAAGKIERDENYFIKIIEMFRNKKKINEDYQHFQPMKENFLYNVMQHKKQSFISKYDKTSFGGEMSFFAKQMFWTNAFFFEDSYHLTFGILTPPMFKSTYPRLMNIARIGFVISHEIGHSVYSVLAETKVLQNITHQHMEESFECRQNQYSQFVMERIGQRLLPNNTENDDFSDNVALQVTEKVVKSLLQSSMEKIAGLPGLDYSPEELFYLFLAQTWCDVRPISSDWKLLLDDAHSPPEFRVRGILQNSKRFSEVFKCATGSYMNPTEKCPVFTGA